MPIQACEGMMSKGEASAKERCPKRSLRATGSPAPSAEHRHPILRLPRTAHAQQAAELLPGLLTTRQHVHTGTSAAWPNQQLHDRQGAPLHKHDCTQPSPSPKPSIAPGHCQPLLVPLLVPHAAESVGGRHISLRQAAHDGASAAGAHQQLGMRGHGLPDGQSPGPDPLTPCGPSHPLSSLPRDLQGANPGHGLHVNPQHLYTGMSPAQHWLTLHLDDIQSRHKPQAFLVAQQTQQLQRQHSPNPEASAQGPSEEHIATLGSSDVPNQQRQQQQQQQPQQHQHCGVHEGSQSEPSSQGGKQSGCVSSGLGSLPSIADLPEISSQDPIPQVGSQPPSGFR